MVRGLVQKWEQLANKPLQKEAAKVVRRSTGGRSRRVDPYFWGGCWEEAHKESKAQSQVVLTVLSRSWFGSINQA